MNNKKIIFLIVLSVLLIASCSSKPSNTNSNVSNSKASNSVSSNSSAANSSAPAATSSGSIVGKWKRSANDIIEYTSDGKVKYTDANGKETAPSDTYTLDTSASPARITVKVKDLGYVPQCIYQIDGSKMKMTCSSGSGQDFPKRFSDSDPTQVIFERL